MKSGNPSFRTTSWTVILNANKEDSHKSEQALAQLCQTYWFPIYTYIRKRGYSNIESEDFTQEYFRVFIEKNYLRSVDRGRGKFRSFLLASVKNFLSNEWHKENAQKRGGNQIPIPMDFAQAESRNLRFLSVGSSPEAIFDKAWAEAIVENALLRLQGEYEKSNRAHLFESLKPFLQANDSDASLVTASEELNLTKGAAKVAIHRLRKKYQTLVHETVLETLEDPNELDAEIRYLVSVLRT